MTTREWFEFVMLLAQIPAVMLGLWLGWRLSEWYEERKRR